MTECQLGLHQRAAIRIHGRPAVICTKCGAIIAYITEEDTP